MNRRDCSADNGMHANNTKTRGHISASEPVKSLAVVKSIAGAIAVLWMWLMSVWTLNTALIAQRIKIPSGTRMITPPTRPYSHIIPKMKLCGCQPFSFLLSFLGMFAGHGSRGRWWYLIPIHAVRL